jgi:glucose/arabinose dehydrogenase
MTIPPVSATTTSSAPSTTTLPRLKDLRLELLVSEGLSQPTFLAAPPGDDRRFVVERVGRILILQPDGNLAPDPFLDIVDRVNSGGIEQGLLGLAFHPDYPRNGRFLVFYYRRGAEATQLSEFVVSSDPDRADPDSERPLLTLDKPTVRHNGGMLQFGPDGFLYLSLGEGGKASAHAQRPETLLGKILRLDLDGGDPYGIPAGNPFIDGGGAPEVWAYGLRNPWRFGIDPVEELIYIGDVGHERWEEIDVLPLDGGGANLGWLRMEGNHCFQSGCDAGAEGLTLPVLEYSHDEGCSVTGGFPYRGEAIPELSGHYFFSDWCGEWVRSFRYREGAVTDLHEWFTDVGQVDSFGLDSRGELYVLTYEGKIYQIVPER